MTLALIAGQGALPRLLAERLVAADDPPVICVLHVFEPNVSEQLPRLPFRLETFGTFLATLTEAGVTRVCMAGAVQRYDFDPSLIDARTAPLIPRLSAAMAQGDDGTLREIIAMFQEAGLTVIGAAELLPDLVLSPDVPTRTKPSQLHLEDALAGDAALLDMAAADLGQACVIRAGQVIAKEGMAGTQALIAQFFAEPDLSFDEQPVAWMIDALRDLTTFDPVYDALPGKGAVLFKAPKPGQDLRVDMPTIGPQTAMDAAAAGFDGIIIAAGQVIVLDPDLIVKILDNSGMFLLIREATS